jgi:soluble lytic murein transglycosylase-like protein
VRALPFVAAAILSGSAVQQGRPPTACPAPAPEPADSLVAEGRYWHAFRAAPPLSAAVASAADLLLHLRIAEGLGQHARIEALLRRSAGFDSVPEVLLIAARQDERARRWMAAAARYRRVGDLPGASPAARATAVSRLPLALDRAGSPAAAAAAWRSAASALPAVADWLALNRARGARDTTSALAARAAATTPGVEGAADSLVASRREASGDLTGALAVYLRRGRRLEAARVELALGRAAAARQHADSVLLEPQRFEALEAARLLAGRFRRLSASELVGIARANAAHARLTTAERWMRRAVSPRDTSLAPLLELAALRRRARRWRGALAALDEAVRRRQATREVEPPAITRMRVEILGAAGRWREAAALVARAVQTSPGDSDIAAAVLFVSEHQRSVAATGQERASYGTLLEHFEGTRAGGVAQFRLALLEYASGRRDVAASMLAAAPPVGATHELRRAWRYWAARMRLEARDPAAPAALRALGDETGTDYYGVRALELLGDPLPLAPDTVAPEAAGRFPASRARERIVILAHVGLEDDARAEARGWLGVPGVPVQVLLEAARGAAAARLGPEAMLLAQAAQRRAGLTADVARALFPFPYRRVIEAEGVEQCVDPLLLAAVIRQESRFQVRARSRAGARGLIQVLPRTGAEMSRQLHLRPWSARLLDVPDFNIHLGARYIRDRERRDSFPLHALIASYNAGRTGVSRWRGRPAFPDADLFVERLPSAGIADYVRRVYVNYAWYRRLYASPGGALR